MHTHTFVRVNTDLELSPHDYGNGMGDGEESLMGSDSDEEAEKSDDDDAEHFVNGSDAHMLTNGSRVRYVRSRVPVFRG